MMSQIELVRKKNLKTVPYSVSQYVHCLAGGPTLFVKINALYLHVRTAGYFVLLKTSSFIVSL